MSEPVEFNERVGAVKLPVSDVKNGTQATVSGWGIMGESNKVRSKYLRKLSVTVYDRKSCQIHMLRNMDKKFKIRMHYSEICGFTHDNVGYGTCPVSSIIDFQNILLFINIFVKLLRATLVVLW